MKKPAEAYREGYEKGRADNIAGHLSEAMLGLMRDDPGGHRAAGYRDGAGGKAFRLPDIAAAESRQVADDIPASDIEKAWYRLCGSSEFIPPPVSKEFWERLRAAGASPAVYMIGLHSFFETSCPMCGEGGHFKGHFLGRLGHPACGSTWYVRPLSYMGKQATAVYHSGLRAGGSVKGEASRKGDRVGGWIQGFLAFYFAAVLRAMLAVVLIPIQATVSLAQQKPKATTKAANGS